MATAPLEDLSKSLDLSLNEKSPEEYIRKTLRAHGFFNHAQASGDTSKTGENQHAAACGISEEDKKRTTQLVSHFKEGKEFHTLKEPHHLYGNSHRSKLRDDSHRKLPYWPAEVECIRQRPTLLTTPPQHLEPYYSPEHDVRPPKIRSGDGLGTVVYMNLPGPEKYFTTARAGPNHSLPPTRVPSPTDVSLQFESRFESGNLSKAVQVGKWDYELYLRYDLYTKKHTQWFYFRVRNMRAGQTYRFTIVNLYKAGSLYNQGMQPVFYSEEEAREHGLGWHRAGHNIKYFKTPLHRTDTKQEMFCFGVTWSHTFKHSGDTCFFAHCYPYTYSDLQDYIQTMLNNREKSKFCKHRVLCRTIAGNFVPLLTITSPSLTPHDNKAKHGVVVTARIHPGETNGSWMMKGLLDFLTGPSDDAKILRDLFVFKIVPMLNPDGVIVGNYRCSLSGRDLNRNYCSKLKDSYPTIWHTRTMVKRFCQERVVILYCDLHGHSRKSNIFIYGCDTLSDPASRLRSRVFPRMLFKNAPDKFSYKSSRFIVQKSKEGTGRVVMWRQAGIQNSYTLEATFSGSTQGKLRGVQFSTAHLEDMGYNLCDTLLDYCDPDQSKAEKIMRELEDDYRQSVLTTLAALGQELPPGIDPLDVPLDPALAEGDSSDAGSNSSESDGPPVHLQWKRKINKKKKKLKSRKERNKQKALLKMNHQRVYSIPATSIPNSIPISHSEKSKEMGRKAEKESECAQEPSEILGSQELARNGGIPMFIQGRLEERQKKRMDEDSGDGVSDYTDALVGVPSEQLRQALLQIQAMQGQQATASTLFLPHPSCPMNISQVHMHDVSRKQSRMNSKISLPQLGSGSLLPPELPPLPLPPTASKCMFTSQYVANHLQYIVPNPSGSHITESSVGNSQNSTRNLTNLSRLFRQLRPQTLQSTRTGNDKQTVKPTAYAVLQGKEERGRHVQQERSQHRDETTIIAASEKTRLTPEHDGKERNDRSEEYTDTKHLSYSKPLARVVMPTERKALAHALSSSSSLSKGRGSRCSSSPMTSSWESFSKGVNLKDRKQEKSEGRIKGEGKEEKNKEERAEKRLGMTGPVRKEMRGGDAVEAHTVVVDAALPAGEPQERDQELFNSTSLVQKKKPKEYSAERHSSAMEPQPPSNSQSLTKTAVKAHKQGIANAVETVHTRRLFKDGSPRNHCSHSSLSNDNSTRHIPMSKSDPLPYSRLQSPLPKQHSYETRHLQLYHAASDVTKADPIDKRGERLNRGKSRADVQVMERETRDGGKQDRHKSSRTAAVTNRHKSDREFQDSIPCSQPENDLSLLHRIYSSKPPSRYGPRPGPSDGIPPATVSLMLSGKLRSRPATMYSSKRPSKHAHIHYYTNRT